MESLDEALRKRAELTDFSGVVRVEQNDRITVEFTRGDANRAEAIANTAATRFGVASGTKGLTALTVMSLIETGELSLSTTLRSVLGNALPLVNPAVTIEQLLCHRSGVGDFLNEELLDDIDEHILGASAHTFEQPSDYGDLMRHHPQASEPGERFAYNNGGYVMLSWVIQRLTGSFHRTVVERVLRPAAMDRSGFFRSDELPPDTALGYLTNGRSNVFHLPVIGAGDGGVYLTLDDTSAFWKAFLAGKIVSVDSVAEMIRIRSTSDGGPSYGMGFWLGHHGDHVWLEGMDAGVSFQSGVRRDSGLRYTLMSNTSSGVWPLVKLIEAAG